MKKNKIKSEYKVVYQNPKIYINPDVLDDLQETMMEELKKDPLYIRYLRKEKLKNIDVVQKKEN